MSQLSHRNHPAIPLLLRTLGGLALEEGGRPVAGSENQVRRLAILAVIALGPTGGTTRDRLLALFWPEADDERGRGALNQALYAIRRMVERDDLILGTTALRLNAEAIEADASAFEKAVAAGDFQQAEALYRGPFFEAVHLAGSPELEEWIGSQRQRLARLLVTAREAMAERASSGGDHKQAVAWRRRLAEGDPLDSTLALRLIEALAASGDRAGAVLHASRHHELLKRELDLPPDPAIAALVKSLRVAPPPGSKPPPPATAGAPDAGPEQPPPAPPAASWRKWVVIGGAALATMLFIQTWLARPDTYQVGRSVQVTFEPGLEVEPALSPDGTVLAYAAGPFRRSRIFIRQPGGRAVAVTPDSGPAQRRPLWSPDGTRLLFVVGGESGLDRALAVVPALGGTPQVLVPRGVASAAWSPDGRRIAYVQGDSLFLRPLDGGPAQGVTRWLDMHSLAWSPDGRLIAFVAGNSLYATWGAGSFGNLGPMSLLVVPVTGGPPVTVAEATSLNASPAWAPDSRRLLFVSDRDGPRDVYAIRLTPTGRPGGPAERLTVGLGPHSIALSADGRRLAWSAYRRDANIWSLPMDTIRPAPEASLAQLTSGSQVVERISVSSDGRRLYFDSNRAGNMDIYRLDLPAGEPVRLTSDKADDFAPAESPDGRWVAFHSLRFGTRDLLLIPASGGDPVRITSDSGEERLPHWSPDGRSIAYHFHNAGERNGGYVMSRDAAGRWGQPVRVAPPETTLEWLPDGRELVYVDPQHSGAILAVRRSGGTPRVIYAPRRDTSDPQAVSVTVVPGDRNLVFKSVDLRDRAAFWRLPPAGGRPGLLARLDDLSHLSPSGNVATDGKRLYFILDDRQSDVYVAELSGPP